MDVTTSLRLHGDRQRRGLALRLRPAGQLVRSIKKQAPRPTPRIRAKKAAALPDRDAVRNLTEGSLGTNKFQTLAPKPIFEKGAAWMMKQLRLK